MLQFQRQSHIISGKERNCKKCARRSRKDLDATVDGKCQGHNITQFRKQIQENLTLFAKLNILVEFSD